MIQGNDFKRPALLLGNGLNNYTHVGTGWTALLKELVNDFMPEKDRAGILKILEKRCRRKGGITYPELFDTLWLRGSDKNEALEPDGPFYGETIESYRQIKTAVQNKIKNWEGKEQHQRLVEFASKNRIPILTTNYDTALLTADILAAHKKTGGKNTDETILPLRIQNTNFPQSDFYLWDAYYSDHVIGTAQDEFGIWHIHGFAAYRRSIILGINDYINVIRKLGTVLGELYQHREPWIGRNSWIDIFLNRDLIIMGLGLESQEITIRRLLMERYKYMRKNRKNLKTLFVYDKKYDPCGPDKRYFFGSLDIEVQAMSGKEMYEQWKWR
jgi:hypothetical protein